MPPGFDVTKLDTGRPRLGDVLAGTPAEMDAACWTRSACRTSSSPAAWCCRRAQFADFLHAKPATRQQILVNLLGLQVYEEVRDQATEVQRRPTPRSPPVTGCWPGWPTPPTRPRHRPTR